MLVGVEQIVEGARGVVAGTPPLPDHWHAGGLAAEAEAAAPPPRSKPSALSAPPATASSIDTKEGEEPITMPFGDLTVSEGKLVKWNVAVGDSVELGHVVAEIETDKTVVEIEAPTSGTIVAIDQQVGAVVPMGGRIGAILK
jgi:2-oxoisovalerate dehydrogenase E1 component